MMRNTQNKKELIMRYVLLIVSLFISGIGIAVTKRGELGVPPISSVANIVSIRFPVLSFGTWLFLWNCLMIVGQIVVLRKDFQWIQLLQIPLSVLFGWFTDFGVWIAGFVPNDGYMVRILLVFLGTGILGFGISLSVIANVVMNSGEAFVKAIADKTNLIFGNVKIGFDVSCVILAMILSLIFFPVRIVGTREGTIIAALCTGLVVNFFKKRIHEPLTAWLCGL